MPDQTQLQPEGLIRLRGHIADLEAHVAGLFAQRADAYAISPGQ